MTAPAIAVPEAANREAQAAEMAAALKELDGPVVKLEQARDKARQAVYAARTADELVAATSDYRVAAIAAHAGRGRILNRLRDLSTALGSSAPRALINAAVTAASHRAALSISYAKAHLSIQAADDFSRKLDVELGAVIRELEDLAYEPIALDDVPARLDEILAQLDDYPGPPVRVAPYLPITPAGDLR